MEKEKILVTQSSMPNFEEYCEKIKGIWDRKWLTNVGPLHEELKENLKKYLDINNIELFTNGHLALIIALKTLNLKGEIITTPFTFASTTNAIVDCGCTPVFCDIDEKTFTIDVNKIESLINEKTVAIMPVHVYGNVCDVEEIERIACKYGLKVIYDAAHTFGETYNGRSVADYGDVSCLSFHATKVFNTIEGGGVVYRDVEIGRKIYNLKNFGIHGPECVEAVGANAKMNEFCASMGICNLRHIDDEIAKRKKLVEHYRMRFEKIEGIILCPNQAGVKSNYAYFPVVFDEKKFGLTRNEVQARLEKHGILARKYFFPLTNSFDCYGNAYRVSDTPIAQYVANRVLTLPLYADLSIEDADFICDVILQSL